MNTVDSLNEAFLRDPGAVYAIVTNRVPCTPELCDDQYVSVLPCPVPSPNGYQLGFMGLLNLALRVNGLPEVRAVFDPVPDFCGNRKFLGFREFTDLDDG